jgi:hypothetical protein
MEEVGNDVMNDKRDTSIYIMTHKAYWMPVDPLYKTVLVGAELHAPAGTETYLKDNTGENISEKNASYSELTGAFWVWKHATEDTIGIFHYRRYLIEHPLKGKEGLLDERQLRQLMSHTDLILPKKRHYYIETVASQYEHAHHKEDLECARSVLSQMHPDYLPSFDLVMQRRSLHLFNIMIARKKLFDAYCSWLFPLLFAIEDKLDISGYSVSDRRVFGYLAERLLDVWIEQNHITYKELPVYNLEKQNWSKKIWYFLKRKFEAKR